MLSKTKARTLSLFVAAAIAVPLSVQAGGITYKDGDKHLKIGGRVQLQYHWKDPDVGESTDSVVFRRLRPYISGTIHKGWNGKLQWDMGKAKGDNEIAVKDAYLQYKGFDKMKVTIGNAGFPFSREYLTSSKKQQLVERTFVGDHHYGTPDRSVGVHLTGEAMHMDMLTYGVSVASSLIKANNTEIDFGSPANKGKSGFNEGIIAGGRIDFHPFGKLKMSQGDFKRKMKATVGVAGYSWTNDHDKDADLPAVGNIQDKDYVAEKIQNVDSVNGFEVSGAFRMMGISIDAQYNSFNADSVDDTLTDGLYQNGTAKLSSAAVEGGYMVMADKLEIVGGYQSQTADTYADDWSRFSLGTNVFFHKQDIKLQTTYRIGKNLKGVTGKDENELFVQMQYVF